MLLADELLGGRRRPLSSARRRAISRGIKKALRGGGLRLRNKKRRKTLRRPMTQARRKLNKIRKQRRYDRHRKASEMIDYTDQYIFDDLDLNRRISTMNYDLVQKIASEYMKETHIPSPNNMERGTSEHFASEIESGYDGNYMSRQNIYQMAEFIETLYGIAESGVETPDWVEDKITRAHAHLSSLHNYYTYGEGSGNFETGEGDSSSEDEIIDDMGIGGLVFDF